jgi:hypothetical protein
MYPAKDVPIINYDLLCDVESMPWLNPAIIENFLYNFWLVVTLPK